MRAVLSQWWVVARHELTDAVRARRAWILLLLYVAGSIVACLMFVHVLHRIENQLLESMGLTVSADAGSATHTLWKSRNFRHIMGGLVGDRDLANRLLDIPPLSLFYGWLSLTFTPLLVMLISAPRIAEEVSTASVRYVLFRTSRATWCTGKAAGQAALLLVALVLSSVAAWAVGMLWMSAFDPGDNAAAMLVLGLKAWVYGLAYLGLALGASQWSRSPVIATGIGLAAMLGLAMAAGAANHWRGPGWFRILDLVWWLTPQSRKLGLWHPDAPQLIPSLVILPVLGFLFFSAGYLRFARRDQ
jgi:ABC-type transport system involved in multi-copper enzyme maturation permease subunit